MVFNKTDIFSFTAKDEYDLSPVKKENRSLDDLRYTWMASGNARQTVFISAKTKDNIEAFRQMLYDEVKKIHVLRYPYNDFLYEF
jgi:GTP-binding protein HflX